MTDLDARRELQRKVCQSSTTLNRAHKAKYKNVNTKPSSLMQSFYSLPIHNRCICTLPVHSY